MAEDKEYLVTSKNIGTYGIAQPSSKLQGQILMYNGSTWVATNPPDSGKIDVIKVNGTAQSIVNKAVDITVPTTAAEVNARPDTWTPSKSDVGLGNVGNFKAVSTVASQGLTDTEKSNARANIGAGTSSFSGNYNDLSNKPTIPTNTNQLTNGAGFITASATITGNAANVTGTVAVGHGGTGTTTLASGQAVIGNGAGAVTTKAIHDSTTYNALTTDNANLATARTVAWCVIARNNRTTNVNVADTNYGTYMARGEALFATDTNPTANGCIAWTYG